MSISILNQPDDLRFGDHLNSLLKQLAFTHFVASVAFVFSSGVHSLEAELEQFLKRGGKATFIVGVSRRVTTVEGLQALLGFARQGADVRVFHNENSAVIYHPKGYLFKGPDKAILLVGSNNLTGKGLFENYELALGCELDPRDQHDAEVLKAIEGVFSRFADEKSGCCKVLDEAFLKELEEEGYLGSETRGTAVPEETGEAEAFRLPPAQKKRLFASKAVKPGPTQPKALAKSAAAAAPLGTLALPAAPAPAALRVGQCFWKALSNWDVHSTSAPGQIQIPFKFNKHFPALHPTPGFEYRTQGRQLDVGFPVIFVNAAGVERSVDDARFIMYEPKPGHKRPNIEYRFTFHDKPIARTLRKDDVLVFERLENSRFRFRIRHITPKNKEYAKFHPGSGKKRRFGTC